MRGQYRLITPFSLCPRLLRLPLIGHRRKSSPVSTPKATTRSLLKIDTDCDDFINLEEFAGFCKKNTGDQDGEMNELHEAFELYDLNKNGLISSTELHQILTRLGERCTVEDCVKMIKSVDSDGDGYVDFEEFKKMMSRS